MATMYFDNNSPGAPALTMVDGSLIAILDWALLQNGWGIQYTATNQRIYRAGSGGRMVLQVLDSLALTGNVTMAFVRAAESASGISTLVDPFPQIAQVSALNNTWAKGNTTSPTVARPWRIIVTPTFFLLATADESTGVNWEINFFGEPPPTNAEDTWNTVVTSRNVPVSSANAASWTSYSAVAGTTLPLAGNVSSPKAYFARDITGTTKSTRAAYSGEGSYVSYLSAGLAPRTGYANRIQRKRTGLHCSASQSATAGPLQLSDRVFLPNLWRSMHISTLGGLSSADTFADSAYNPASLFNIITPGNGGMLFIEQTDTWTLPT